MRFILLAVLAAAPVAAQPADGPAVPAAPADKAVMARQIDMGAMGHHERTYTYNRFAVDYARSNRSDVLNWDVEGWVGGDRNKFWYKSEGERAGREVEQAEFQALYSRNVWTFFDVQGGLRYVLEPDRRGYAVIGVQGLAPYLLETELHAFIGFKGDVLVRYKQSFDLRMTNRLIVQPSLETDLYLTDARERRIVSGFSRIETGVAVRYEFSRKFAPYVAVVYDRKLGGTAQLARADGEDPGGWMLRSGVRIWF